MKYCKSCKLNIENNIPKCPLCHSLLQETSADNYNNDYPHIERSYVTELVNRIILFAAVVISVVAVFVNFYFFNTFPWSAIVVMGVIYLSLSAKSLIRKKQNYGFVVLAQVFLISLVSFAIDRVLILYQNHHGGWSLSYVIPLVIILGSVTLYVLSIFKPFTYKDYFIYLIIIALLGLAPLIFMLTKIVDVYWANAMCLLYSILTVISMLIFTRRRFKSELKKRLHF